MKQIDKRYNSNPITTVKEAAKAMGCTPAHVYKLYYRGEIRGYCINKRDGVIRVYVKSVEEYIK